MIDNLLIAVYSFARLMLTSLSVDEILLPRYVYLSINFRGLLLRIEMASCRLKLMNPVFVCLFLFFNASCCFTLGFEVRIQFEQVYL